MIWLGSGKVRLRRRHSTMCRAATHGRVEGTGTSKYIYIITLALEIIIVIIIRINIIIIRKKIK